MIQPQFRSFGRAVVATPWLPYDVFRKWTENDANSRSLTSTQRLRTLLNDQKIRDAIRYALPAISERVDRWRNDNQHDDALERTILRALSLLTTCVVASIPLSAYGLVQISDAHTKVESAKDGEQFSFSVSDGWLVLLGDYIATLPEIQKHIRFRPNTSLYRAGAGFRYIRRDIAGAYTLVSADITDHMQLILDNARAGASIATLGAALTAADPAIETSDAEQFVGELVEAGVLVATMPLPVVGRPDLGELSRRVRALDSEKSALLAERLANSAEQAARLRQTDLLETDKYNELIDALCALNPNSKRPSFRISRLLNPGAISRDVIADALHALDVISRISQRTQFDRFARFRNSFIERYGGQEVPLPEVLDEDIGIGLSGWEESPESSDVTTVPVGRDSEHLLNLVCNAAARHEIEVSLSSADIEILTVKPSYPNLPPIVPSSLCMTLRLLALAGENDVAQIVNVSLPAAAPLEQFRSLGELTELVHEVNAAEEAQKPNVLHAELVHAVVDIDANDIFREGRAYEVTFLANSSLPESKKIEISDLLMSVRGMRIVLRSRRLGRVVEPKLTSSHRITARQPPAYRFLAALQLQNCAYGLLDIGVVAKLPFVPRIRVGRIVLRPATWRVPTAELNEIVARRARAKAFSALCAELRIPRWVAISEGESPVSLDLNNDTCIDIILDRAENVTTLTLLEDLERVTRDGYATEFVVPLVRNRAPHIPTATAAVTQVVAVHERRFIAGSEWLAIKMYAGPFICERLLSGALGDALKQLPRWFFLRGSKPSNYLALYIHGDGRILLNETWPRLEQLLRPSFDDGTVWRVQLDTYEREIERFGGVHGAELSEHVAHADSICALDLMRECQRGMSSRWSAIACGTDRLWRDFGLDRLARCDVSERMRTAMMRSYNGDTNVLLYLSQQYQNERLRLRELILDHQAPAQWLYARSEVNKDLARQLNDAHTLGVLGDSVGHLVMSYAHYWANRNGSDDLEELSFYDCLCRYYGEYRDG
jgi:lantibiotic biosynthesis protein